MNTGRAVAPRIRYLDGMRAVAALVVVLHHAYLTAFPLYPTQQPAGPLGPVAGLLDYGAVGVPVFIALSGYSLMQPVLRRGMRVGGLRSFAGKRARRILPPYLAAWLLALVLNLTFLQHRAGTHWDTTLPLHVRGPLVDAFLLQDVLPVFGVSPGANVDHVFWSIAVEAHIYLIFPLLVVGWRRLPRGWVTVAAVAALLAVLVASRDGAGWVLRLSALHPELYLVFVLGAGAAIVVHRFGRRPPLVAAPWAWITLVLVAGTVGILAMHGDTWYAAHLSTAFLAEGVCAVTLLLHLGLDRPGLARRALSTRPLVFLGVASYSIYLVHAPLVEVAWRLLPARLDLVRGERLLVLLALLPLVLVVCVVFWAVVERPLLRPSVRAAERTELRRGGSATARPASRPSPRPARRELSPGRR